MYNNNNNNNNRNSKQLERQISLLTSQLVIIEKRLVDADEYISKLVISKEQNEKRLNRRIKELSDQQHKLQHKNVNLQNQLEKSRRVIGKLEKKLTNDISKPMVSINLVVHLLSTIRKRDNHIASLNKINRMLADSNKLLVDERDNAREELKLMYNNVNNYNNNNNSEDNIYDDNTTSFNNKTSVSLKDLSQYSEKDIEHILPDESKSIAKSKNRKAKVSMEDIRDAFNRYSQNY